MWKPCRCGDYWCTDHQEHAHDCQCPPIEEAHVSPYANEAQRLSHESEAVTVRLLKWDDIDRMCGLLSEDNTYGLNDIRGANGAGPKMYGIPRGGQIVAALLRSWVDDSKIVDTPQEADVIVDDILDSGLTAARWSDKYDKPVVCLVSKRPVQPPEMYEAVHPNNLPGKWVVFPWDVRVRNDDEP